MTKKDSKGRNLKPNEDQMKDGRYRYRYTDKHGNRKAVYSWRLVTTDRTPATKRDDICLRDKEKQIERDLEDGINSYKANLTVGKLVETYLETKTNIAKSTIENYRYMCQHTIKKSKLGKQKICDVKKSDIKLFYKYLHEERNFTIGTIQLYQNLLFPSFQLAMDDDIIRKNPCFGCMKDYHRGSLDSNRKPLTQEEQKRLLSYVKNSTMFNKYYIMLVFMLSTGLRMSEMLGITWDNIYLDKGYIEVNHQITYRKMDGSVKHRVGLPKNGCSRIIPIQPSVVDLLHEHKKSTYLESQLSGINIEGYSEFVFLNKESKLYTPNSLTRTFRNIVEAHNKEIDEDDSMLLPQFSAHVLRHTFCTRMAENGCDIKVLQEIMGHKNIKVTMQVYNHSSEERALKEFQRLGTVIDF